MKRSKLNSFLGKTVFIEFIDGDVAMGKLSQGMGLGNNYYNDDPKWYHFKNSRLNFRLSHVKRVEEVIFTEDE